MTPWQTGQAVKSFGDNREFEIELAMRAAYGSGVASQSDLKKMTFEKFFPKKKDQKDDEPIKMTDEEFWKWRRQMLAREV